MPRPAKGPRLYLRPARPGQNAVWVILDTIDGRHEESTGCSPDDRRGAEKALKEYIARKHVATVVRDVRDPENIPVANVIALYAKHVAGKHARPEETASRLKRLLEFFDGKVLAQINGDLCREYAATRTPAAARRELEELRAAINFHRREGHCTHIISVALPEPGAPRERWLTRKEAAQLIRAAWRYREIQKGVPTDRRSREHVAKFILVGLYTGTRAGAICSAAFERVPGRGWIDLEHGVFHRRAAGEKETKKRKPPIRLPDRLLAHLRRWSRSQRYVVEWQRGPIGRVTKAFNNVVRDAGLGRDVTPHVLRHTCATWLMQGRADIYEASGYLGMTVEMLLERYGHHHPDFQESARNAFAKMRKR